MSAHPYPGRFVRQGLMTSDVPAAKGFYGGLFGWTFEGAGRGRGSIRSLIRHQGEVIGGLSPKKDQHTPDIWIPSIVTSDVDEFCLRATDMGATVHRQPVDIAGTGRLAIIADPQGGIFSPLTEPERYEVPQPAPGAASGRGAWYELMTTDPSAAIAFYGRMFGWTSRITESDGDVHALLEHRGVPVAGIGRKPASLPGAMWVLYFEVENIDTSMQRVIELGGSIEMPKTPVDSVGTIAWIADATGAMLGLVQTASGANTPARSARDTLHELVAAPNRSMP